MKEKGEVLDFPLFLKEVLKEEQAKGNFSFIFAGTSGKKENVSGNRLFSCFLGKSVFLF